MKPGRQRVTFHSVIEKQLWNEWYEHKCELPIKIVRSNKPKALTGLNQKVREQDNAAGKWRYVTVASPVEWEALTRSVNQSEHGKPV